MTPQQRATAFMKPMKSGGPEASNRRFQLDEADVEAVIQDAIDEERSNILTGIAKLKSQVEEGNNDFQYSRVMAILGRVELGVRKGKFI